MSYTKSDNEFHKQYTILHNKSLIILNNRYVFTRPVNRSHDNFFYFLFTVLNYIWIIEFTVLIRFNHINFI